MHLETSKDFKTWTNHGLIFHADDLDQELGRENIKTRLADATLEPMRYNDPGRYNVDVYNMGVFRYESIYLGLPTFYHAVGQDGLDPCHVHAQAAIPTIGAGVALDLGRRQ